ncbi:hypothetical protein BU993_11165 [Flavobacterium columnare]|nr:hypothetical protein BU993_11165 [Flavobacterium columnare]
MNNLICDKKKKTLKSYDFKVFNSICISTGGERGSRTFLILLYQIFHKIRCNQLFVLIFCKDKKSLIIFDKIKTTTITTTKRWLM